MLDPPLICYDAGMQQSFDTNPQPFIFKTADEIREKANRAAAEADASFRPMTQQEAEERANLLTLSRSGQRWYARYFHPFWAVCCHIPNGKALIEGLPRGYQMKPGE